MSILATQFLSCAVQAASDGVASGQLAASGCIPAKTRDDLALALARNGGGESRYDWLAASNPGGPDDMRLCFGLMYMWESVNAQHMRSALRGHAILDDEGAADATRSLVCVFFAGYCDGSLGRRGRAGSVFHTIYREVNRFAGPDRTQAQAA